MIQKVPDQFGNIRQRTPDDQHILLIGKLQCKGIQHVTFS